MIKSIAEITPGKLSTAFRKRSSKQNRHIKGLLGEPWNGEHYQRRAD